MLARERFFHFHGEPVARIDPSTRIYGAPSEQKQKSVIVRYLSLLFFDAPIGYINELDNIHSDNLKVIPVSALEDFVDKIKKTWTETTLFVRLPIPGSGKDFN